MAKRASPKTKRASPKTKRGGRKTGGSPRAKRGGRKTSSVLKNHFSGLAAKFSGMTKEFSTELSTLAKRFSGKFDAVIEKISAPAAAFVRLDPRRRRIVLPFVALGVGFFGYMILVATAPKTEPSENRERVWSVAAQNIERVTYVPRIRAFGELRARRQIDLRAQVAGEVVKTSPIFEDGTRVAAGDILLEIDPFNYDTTLKETEAQLKGAQAVLAERKATMRQAKGNYNRAKELVKKGTVSKKTLDDRATDFTIHKARRDQQQAIVDRRKVLRDRAKRDLENTKLVAPFDAHIGNIAAREGRVLNQNDRVATLSDANEFEIRFNLSDAAYGRFLARNADVIGQKLDAVWALGTQRVTLKAVIRRVGASISQATRGVDVFAGVEGALPSNARGGAFVTIDLEAQPVRDVVIVPRRAIYGGNKVFVVINQHLQPRELVKFVDLGNEFLVSEGLEAGEQILITRFNEAAPDVRVKVVDVIDLVNETETTKDAESNKDVESNERHDDADDTDDADDVDDRDGTDERDT